MSRPARRRAEPEVRVDPAPAGVEDRLALAARREYAFQSLIELGHDLTVALDVYETADLLLFNLMGQLGAARSALWLVPEADEEKASTPAVLVRVHGFHRPVVEAIGSACAAPLLRRFETTPVSALAWALREDIGSAPFELVRHAQIALFAPLRARGELLGWLAIGPRVDGSAYSDSNLQVLEASLGMVAMSLQNARLYNRARETNRRLRTTNQDLNELDRLKTEFLNNVSHELRTPLAVILATLECVVDDGVEDKGTRDLLAGSLEQSRKLHGLIENLLRFSEVRNARLPIHVMADDVVAALDACVEQRLPGVTAGLRELVYRRVEGLAPARFDRARLLQILDELVDNATKFTPRGSRIEIAAGRTSEDGRDWLVIEVKDDGPGIAAEHMASVFRSFEQGDGSMTRGVGGLGMGLALARDLAERMGGRLIVDSTPGRGSTFRLLLPLA